MIMRGTILMTKEFIVIFLTILVIVIASLIVMGLVQTPTLGV